MAGKSVKKFKRAERRRQRVRGKLSGTSACPRLTVAKSLKNVFVQIVDDVHAVTLAAAASNSKNVLSELKPEMTKSEVARKVGEVIAREAKAKGIEAVVFDRNRFRFHGRVKAVAEGARSGGLKF
ncbi:MAG TPA: 50S ribosomal protein L18 [candidate division Zixibacteria bacterium]|nr:50S ribosomal protein L18 [candidate division Zixibacteria bacterium]